MVSIALLVVDELEHFAVKYLFFIVVQVLNRKAFRLSWFLRYVIGLIFLQTLVVIKIILFFLRWVMELEYLRFKHQLLKLEIPFIWVLLYVKHFVVEVLQLFVDVELVVFGESLDLRFN